MKSLNQFDVNKFQLLTVLLMPSALNNSQSDIININLTLSNKTTDYNTTIRIELNSLDAKTTTAKSKPISSTTKKLIILKENINLKPVKNNLNLDFLPPNISYIYPGQFNYSNQYLNEVYANYFSYLNWSLSNGFISDLGFRYKLFHFYAKLTKELNETYPMLVTSLSYQQYNETSYLNEIIFNILFNNNQTILNDYDKQVLINKFLNETNSNGIFKSLNKRHKRDTFADSLRFVNRIFNQIYGYMPRKVPAHIPHLIDKQIMKSLQNKFNLEFDLTSSHRLRSANDMQYAFSYYYYIMSELKQFDAYKLFDEIDINQNGQLDELEVMIINLKLSSKPFSSSNIGAPALNMFTINTDLLTHLNNCKSNSTDQLITKNIFVKCLDLVDYLKDRLWNFDLKSSNARYAYKYETLGDEDTKFVMIAGDPFEIEIKLNNIIRDPCKFVCLNDNIDYKIKHEANEMKRLLKYFYSALFPLPSQFELMDCNNRITLINEVKEISNFNKFLIFCLPVMVFICVFKFFKICKKKTLKYSASKEILKNI